MNNEDIGNYSHFNKKAYCRYSICDGKSVFFDKKYPVVRRGKTSIKIKIEENK